MKLFGTKTSPHEDVGITIFLDDFTDVTCGLEHPKLAGNECRRSYGHVEDHEDLAGNTWKGKDYR